MEQQTAQTNKPIARGTLSLFTAPAKIVSAPLERHFQKKYAGRYRFARHLFLFDLGLFCIALALAVTSAAWIALPARVPEPVVLRIEQSPRNLFPNEAPKNGAPVAFTATVQNHSGSLITDAVLRFRLPPYFRLLSAPTTFQGDAGTIALGDLPNGATRVVGITALALNETLTEKKPTLFLQFRGQRAGASFDVVSAQHVEMARESVITASPAFPASVVSGDTISVPVTIANRGGVALGPLQILLCPQGGFLPAALEEKPDACMTHSVSLLGAGERVVVMLPLVAQAPRTDARIRAAVAIQTPRGALSLLDQTFVTRILKRYASVTLHADAHSAEQTTRAWNLQVEGRDPALLLDAAQLLLTVGETETVLAQLTSAELSALQRGERVLVRTVLSADARGTVVADITAHVDADDPQPFHLRSSVVALDSVSPLSLTATARYYSVDGEQLGRGPLPPVAGQQTTYWLFVRIPSLPEGTTSVDMTAALPSGVRWLDQQSVSPTGMPEMTVDTAHRLVRWSARAVPLAVTGGGIGLAAAVAVTPSTQDVGKEMPILGSVELRVRTADGATLSATTTPITTALLGDAQAAGKGIVVGE